MRDDSLVLGSNNAMSRVTEGEGEGREGAVVT